MLLTSTFDDVARDHGALSAHPEDIIRMEKRGNSNAIRNSAARAAPKGAASLEQVEQEVEAARQEQHHLTGQREQVTQSIRAIGRAYHLRQLDLKQTASYAMHAHLIPYI
jgi:hypothetical protein